MARTNEVLDYDEALDSIHLQEAVKFLHLLEKAKEANIDFDTMAHDLMEVAGHLRD